MNPTPPASPRVGGRWIELAIHRDLVDRLQARLDTATRRIDALLAARNAAGARLSDPGARLGHVSQQTITVTTTVTVDDGDLADRVTTLEGKMTDAVSAIQGLQAQFDGFTADVDAALAKLQAQIDVNDPAAVQAAIDAFATDLGAARAKVGDANADGDPAPATDPTPTDPGTPAV